MRTFGFFTASLACMAIGSVGCLPDDYDINVTLRYPDDRPASDIEVTVLPFDRDVLRDSIAEANGIPRPRFNGLLSQLKSYQQPDLSGLTETLAPWQAIYDSVRSLADSLNAVGPDSSIQYAGAYGRLRDQYQRLAQTTVQRDAAISDLVGDTKDLAMRAAAAADSLRAWEGDVLAIYPQLADSAIARSGRSIHRAKTDENGVAAFTLLPGDWWVVARCYDPENPFIERYWNISKRVRLFGSKSVILDVQNGVDRWKY